MPDALKPSSEPPSFSRARAHIKSGLKARDALGECWAAFLSTGPFTCRTIPDSPMSGQLELRVDWPAEVRREMEHTAQRFVDSVVAAFNESVRAAVYAAAGESVASVARMPFCVDEASFFAELKSPLDKHLRPDQLDLVIAFQPFGDASVSGGVTQEVRQSMKQLYALLIRSTDQPCVAVWAYRAEPLFRGRNGEHVTVDCIPADAGILNSPRSIAQISSRERLVSEVSFNANVELGVVFDTPAHERGSDDLLDRQTLQILGSAQAFAEAMERSSSADGLMSGFEWFAQQVARRERSPWGRVDIARNQIGKQLRRGLKSSDLGIVRYTTAEGDTTIFVKSDGEVFARPVPAATPAPKGQPNGQGAERASLLAASEWGLADFVMRPQLIHKGRASREIGDGTVVVGNRALAIQVKARTQASESTDREQQWVRKQITQAGNQASGTIRHLRSQPVALENQRDRKIVVDGSKLSWLRVVIIDHPNPFRLRLEREANGGDELVALYRRDWEFLLDQLRSLSAVVDYLFRVGSDDSYEIGNESTRYFELARADSESKSRPASWARRFSENTFTTPTLPITPASRMNATGHLVYQIVLEDLSEVPWDRDESDRLYVLSLLDKFPVAERAALGKLLVDRLKEVMLETSGVKWLIRRILIDDGRLQLAFVTATRRDEHVDEAFRQWAILRHHEFTQPESTNARATQRTVAVMLTPRFDGTRYWDNTYVVLSGDLQTDAADLERFRNLWSSPPAA